MPASVTPEQAPAPAQTSASQEVQRWKRWGAMVGKVASAQLLVQFINAVTGFLIVRSLGKTEYAWFTIINTTAAVLATMGDGGLASGLLSAGGKVWQEREPFSRLVTTAIRLRFIIAGLAALGAVPWAFWMLTKTAAPASLSAALLFLSLAGSVPAAEIMVLSIAPRLRSEIYIQQMSDLLGASLRLVLSGAAVLIMPVTLPLVLAVTVCQWCQLIYMRSRVGRVLDLKAPPSDKFRTELLRVVRSLWFPTAFNCFQAQIGTFILSMFGKTTSVAELGALSRFGVIFSVLLTVVVHLLAPAFARSQSPAALRGLLIRSLLALLAACGGLTAWAFFFPGTLLWVIGKGYSGLHRELVLLFIFQSGGALLSFGWALNSARGWVRQSWLTPPATVIAQMVLLQVMDISTLTGTMWFMILSHVPPFLVLIYMATRGFSQWHRTSQKSAS